MLAVKGLGDDELDICPVPEFEFSEQFCDGEIRIPFSDLVEERTDNHVDRSDFMMTRDDLMMITSYAMP